VELILKFVLNLHVKIPIQPKSVTLLLQELVMKDSTLKGNMVTAKMSKQADATRMVMTHVSMTRHSERSTNFDSSTSPLS
jgi:hypothetical protein